MRDALTFEGDWRDRQHVRSLCQAGLRDKDMDDGCIAFAMRSGAATFIAPAEKGRVWAREPKILPLPEKK
jgi:hypothetical protein